MRSPIEVIYNFHWVTKHEVARSAQAYAGMLGPFLRRHQIRSVVNLRGHNQRFGWWRYESRVCERLHIEHHNLKFNSRTLPSRELLIAMLHAFDVSQKPALIKCSGGQDRTSFAAALYLIHRDGWNALACALQQFAKWPYLHFPKPQQKWLRMFLPYAEQQSGGQPIGRWIAEDYTPEDFMAWLDNRGHSESFRNLPGRPPRKLENISAGRADGRTA